MVEFCFLIRSATPCLFIGERSVGRGIWGGGLIRVGNSVLGLGLKCLSKGGDKAGPTLPSCLGRGSAKGGS